MNKTLKKTLSIILTILMIVTTVPFAFAAGDGMVLYVDIRNAVECVESVEGIWISAFAKTGNQVLMSNKKMTHVSGYIYSYEIPSNTYIAAINVPNTGVSGISWNFVVDWTGNNLYVPTGNNEGTWKIYSECFHERYTYGKCDECGHRCLHENYANDKCDDCGSEGKVITITMTDTFGNGWDGNAVKIEQLINGTYTEVARATFNSGRRGTFTAILPEDGVYAFRWVEDDYSYECSFTIAVDDEMVYSEGDGRTLVDGQVLYAICEHNFDGEICTECGFDCGVDFEHEITDSICTVCGKYMYAITHQPTAAEPYVELNNDTDATYQWYKVEGVETEFTDENAEAFDPEWFGLPEEVVMTTAAYNDATGWSPAIFDNIELLGYFGIELKTGETVSFEFSSAPKLAIALNLLSGEEFLLIMDGKKASFTAEEDGLYVLMTQVTMENSGELITVKAYFGEATYTAIEGETAAELENIVYGKKYVCEVTYGDGTKETSDTVDFSYKITHQPTEAEPYVELNYDTDATYQWYKADENKAITDENASTVSYDWGESSYDKETGWTGVPHMEDYYGQDFFTVALEAGETVVIEVTGDFANRVGLYDYDTGEEIWVDYIEGVTSYELTVESECNYTFYTYVNSGVVTVKATFTKTNYTAIEGQTAATLTPAALGKYACEAIFADGTKKMSDIFEVTHICDFSGEWKADSEKHWKECSCGDIAEESTHSWNFGKCTVCEYACKHSFTKYAETEAPRCGVAGKEVAGCNNGCGAMNEREIPALAHKDNNGDYKCDHGCGHEFEKPAEPDTPDVPTDGNCDHMCHKTGFVGFIWKIISFLQRFFGIQQYCDCGELHYEKAIFG